MLIEQSIAKQYGILPSRQDDLSFADWYKLLGGLMPDTPLGQVVSLRAERDPEIVKRMSPDQKRLRGEWAAFRARRNGPVAGQDAQAQMKQLCAMVAGLFGGK